MLLCCNENLFMFFRDSMLINCYMVPVKVLYTASSSPDTELQRGRGGAMNNINDIYFVRLQQPAYCSQVKIVFLARQNKSLDELLNYTNDV